MDIKAYLNVPSTGQVNDDEKQLFVGTSGRHSRMENREIESEDNYSIDEKEIGQAGPLLLVPSAGDGKQTTSGLVSKPGLSYEKFAVISDVTNDQQQVLFETSGRQSRLENREDSDNFSIDTETGPLLQIPSVSIDTEQSGLFSKSDDFNDLGPTNNVVIKGDLSTDCQQSLNGISGRQSRLENREDDSADNFSVDENEGLTVDETRLRVPLNDCLQHTSRPAAKQKHVRNSDLAKKVLIKEARSAGHLRKAKGNMNMSETKETSKETYVLARASEITLDVETVELNSEKGEVTMSRVLQKEEQVIDIKEKRTNSVLIQEPILDKFTGMIVSYDDIEESDRDQGTLYHIETDVSKTKITGGRVFQSGDEGSIKDKDNNSPIKRKVNEPKMSSIEDSSAGKKRSLRKTMKLRRRSVPAGGSKSQSPTESREQCTEDDDKFTGENGEDCSSEKTSIGSRNGENAIGENEGSENQSSEETSTTPSSETETSSDKEAEGGDTCGDTNENDKKQDMKGDKRIRNKKERDIGLGEYEKENGFQHQVPMGKPESNNLFEVANTTESEAKELPYLENNDENNDKVNVIGATVKTDGNKEIELASCIAEKEPSSITFGAPEDGNTMKEATNGTRNDVGPPNSDVVDAIDSRAVQENILIKEKNKSDTQVFSRDFAEIGVPFIDFSSEVERTQKDCKEAFNTSCSTNLNGIDENKKPILSKSNKQRDTPTVDQSSVNEIDNIDQEAVESEKSSLSVRTRLTSLTEKEHVYNRQTDENKKELAAESVSTCSEKTATTSYSSTSYNSSKFIGKIDKEESLQDDSKSKDHSVMESLKPYTKNNDAEHDNKSKETDIMSSLRADLTGADSSNKENIDFSDTDAYISEISSDSDQDTDFKSESTALYYSDFDTTSHSHSESNSDKGGSMSTDKSRHSRSNTLTSVPDFEDKDRNKSEHLLDNGKVSIVVEPTYEGLLHGEDEKVMTEGIQQGCADTNKTTDSNYDKDSEGKSTSNFADTLNNKHEGGSSSVQDINIKGEKLNGASGDGVIIADHNLTITNKPVHILIIETAATPTSFDRALDSRTNIRKWSEDSDDTPKDMERNDNVVQDSTGLSQSVEANKDISESSDVKDVSENPLPLTTDESAFPVSGMHGNNLISVGQSLIQERSLNFYDSENKTHQQDAKLHTSPDSDDTKVEYSIAQKADDYQGKPPIDSEDGQTNIGNNGTLQESDLMQGCEIEHSNHVEKTVKQFASDMWKQRGIQPNGNSNVTFEKQTTSYVNDIENADTEGQKGQEQSSLQFEIDDEAQTTSLPKAYTTADSRKQQSRYRSKVFTCDDTVVPVKTYDDAPVTNRLSYEELISKTEKESDKQTKFEAQTTENSSISGKGKQSTQDKAYRSKISGRKRALERGTKSKGRNKVSRKASKLLNQKRHEKKQKHIKPCDGVSIRSTVTSLSQPLVAAKDGEDKTERTEFERPDSSFSKLSSNSQSKVEKSLSEVKDGLMSSRSKALEAVHFKKKKILEGNFKKMKSENSNDVAEDEYEDKLQNAVVRRVRARQTFVLDLARRVVTYCFDHAWNNILKSERRNKHICTTKDCNGREQICCVIKSSCSSFDVTSITSDVLDPLSVPPMTDKHEVLLSHVIRLSSQEMGQLTSECEFLVYIPFEEADVQPWQEPLAKEMHIGGEWTESTCNVTTISHWSEERQTPVTVALPMVRPGMFFHRMSETESFVLKEESDVLDITPSKHPVIPAIGIKQQDLKILVLVSRPKQELIAVSDNDVSVTSSVDERVSMGVFPGFEHKRKNITMQIIPIEPSVVLRFHEVNYKDEEETKLLASSPLVMIKVLDNSPESLQFSVPCLSPYPYRKNRSISSANSTRSANSARYVIEKLRSSSTLPSSEKLTSSSGGYSSRPTTAGTTITSSLRPNSALSGFGGSSDTHLVLLDKGLGVRMKLLDNSESEDDVELLNFSIYDRNSRFIAMETTAGLRYTEVDELARAFTDFIAKRESLIQIVQTDTDPHIACLSVDLSTKITKHDITLFEPKKSGRSHVVLLEDGDIVQIKMRGNIDFAESDDTNLFAFYGCIGIRKIFKTKIVDPYCQRSLKYFHGVIQVFLLKVKRSTFMQRDVIEKISEENWSLLLEVPLDLPKEHKFTQSSATTRKAPLDIPIEEPMTIEYISEMADDLVEDWDLFAEGLELDHARIQSLLQQNKNIPSARLILDILLCWMKRMPKGCDKVVLLLRALRHCQKWYLAKILDDRYQALKDARRKTAREAKLQNTISTICESPTATCRWRELVSNLGLHEDEIRHFDSKDCSESEKCHSALQLWKETARYPSVWKLSTKLRQCRCNVMADFIITHFS